MRTSAWYTGTPIVLGSSANVGLDVALSDEHVRLVDGAWPTDFLATSKASLNSGQVGTLGVTPGTPDWWYGSSAEFAATPPVVHDPVQSFAYPSGAPVIPLEPGAGKAGYWSARSADYELGLALACFRLSISSWNTLTSVLAPPGVPPGDGSSAYSGVQYTTMTGPLLPTNLEFQLDVTPDADRPYGTASIYGMLVPNGVAGMSENFPAQDTTGWTLLGTFPIGPVYTTGGGTLDLSGLSAVDSTTRDADTLTQVLLKVVTDAVWVDPIEGSDPSSMSTPPLVWTAARIYHATIPGPMYRWIGGSFPDSGPANDRGFYVAVWTHGDNSVTPVQHDYLATVVASDPPLVLEQMEWPFWVTPAPVAVPLDLTDTGHCQISIPANDGSYTVTALTTAQAEALSDEDSTTWILLTNATDLATDHSHIHEAMAEVSFGPIASSVNSLHLVLRAFGAYSDPGATGPDMTQVYIEVIGDLGGSPYVWWGGPTSVANDNSWLDITFELVDPGVALGTDHVHVVVRGSYFDTLEIAEWTLTGIPDASGVSGPDKIIGFTRPAGRIGTQLNFVMTGAVVGGGMPG